MKITNAIFYSHHITKAIEAYIQLGFEFNQEKSSENFVSFVTDTQGLFFSINRADGDWKTPGKQSVVFAVKDLDTFYSKAKEIGFGVVKDIHISGYGKTFTCHDLDDNKLMFTSS
jgi:predicted lactoylglutathione lyase